MRSILYRLRRLRCSFRGILGANCAVVVLALFLGWGAASSGKATFHYGILRENAHRDNVLGDFRYIVKHNFLVAGFLATGVFCLGVSSMAGLALNSFCLGFDLSALTRGSPRDLYFLLKYVPLEFLAFILIASASQWLSITAARTLLLEEDFRFGGGLQLIAIGLLILTMAAFIESNEKHAREQLTPRIGGLSSWTTADCRSGNSKSLSLASILARSHSS